MKLPSANSIIRGGKWYVQNNRLQFLLQSMFGTKKTNITSSIQLSQLNSDSVQAQLKAAGNTLRQYERAYTQAFVNAVKAIDPKWELRKEIPSGALNGITRKSIDSLFVRSGN